jgi:hypothetical protein
MKEKEKDLYWLGPAHNEASLTARIRSKSKKKAYSNLDILH